MGEEIKSQQKFQRSRNVGRNVVFGLLNRFFALLMPFIVRTVLIFRFGAIYLGMNSLLASVFHVLNLAELGFGTAVVYSLYRPVAEQDTETVCSYLGTYRRIYRTIGGVILVLGLAVMPFFPSLLKGKEVPTDMDVSVWYLIFLADAVASYLLFGYKTAIPSALQREDIISKINTVVLICKSVVQVICLLFTDNFYFYLLSSLLFTVIRNFLISFMVSRYYPQYVCKGGISHAQSAELKKLVYGLALSKLRGVSRHAIDNICITAFIGLTMTAIYDNYFCIHSAVIAIMRIFSSAMTPSVGNSIATESTEKTWRDMRRFNFIYMLLAGWATICLLCLYQPFMKHWVGPKLMLGYGEVIALSLYFYVLKMGDMRWIYFQGAGLWWKARYIVIAEFLCNVLLNILLAKYWGVLGIIIATLISLFFINFIGEAWVLFKEYFKNGKLGTFFADQARYFLVTTLLAILSIVVCDKISAVGIIELLARGILCTGIALTGYFLVYHRTMQYQDAMNWIAKRVNIFIR